MCILCMSLNLHEKQEIWHLAPPFLQFLQFYFYVCSTRESSMVLDLLYVILIISKLNWSFVKKIGDCPGMPKSVYQYKIWIFTNCLWRGVSLFLNRTFASKYWILWLFQVMFICPITFGPLKLITDGAPEASAQFQYNYSRCFWKIIFLNTF